MNIFEEIDKYELTIQNNIKKKLNSFKSYINFYNFNNKNDIDLHNDINKTDINSKDISDITIDIENSQSLMSLILSKRKQRNNKNKLKNNKYSNNIKYNNLKLTSCFNQEKLTKNINNNFLNIRKNLKKFIYCRNELQLNKEYIYKNMVFSIVNSLNKLFIINSNNCFLSNINKDSLSYLKTRNTNYKSNSKIKNINIKNLNYQYTESYPNYIIKKSKIKFLNSKSITNYKSILQSNDNIQLKINDIKNIGYINNYPDYNKLLKDYKLKYNEINFLKCLESNKYNELNNINNINSKLDKYDLYQYNLISLLGKFNYNNKKNRIKKNFKLPKKLKELGINNKNLLSIQNKNNYIKYETNRYIIK